MYTLDHSEYIQHNLPRSRLLGQTRMALSVEKVLVHSLADPVRHLIRRHPNHTYIGSAFKKFQREKLSLQ